MLLCSVKVYQSGTDGVEDLGFFLFQTNRYFTILMG